MTNEDLIKGCLEGFGHDNAKTACEVIYKPTDPKYAESIRRFQGCPTIAVTKKGRIFLGWYSGGVKEPHIENYNILTYSDDDGKTFGKPYIVIPSDESRLVHALDIQLWVAPTGALWLFWVQNNVLPDSPENAAYLSNDPQKPTVNSYGYVFPDMRHTEWCMVCEDPDADEPVFSAPVMLDIGFLRCKPLVTESGRWLFFNYDQLTDRYGYSISDDNGKNFTRHYGGKKQPTPFDEGIAYQKKDGSIRLLARTNLGYIAESISVDDGETWSDGVLTEMQSPNTRLFVSRTPSGRILLVNNDDSAVRQKMTLYLSEDDGATFKYKKTFDARRGLSYPDVDFRNGRIYLTYDRERTGAKEILFLSFTEEDIMDPSVTLEASIVSKP